MISEELIFDEFREAKTKLKSYTVENGYERPEYETVSKRLEDFRKIYKVRVTIDGLVDITGEGYSRRLAEHRAAINALKEIKEVRDEQQKSKLEEELAKEKKNGFQDDEEVVTNGTNGTNGDTTEDSTDNTKEVNGSYKDEDESQVSSDNKTNSIIISADINTSTEEEGLDEKLVNGNIDPDKSQSSSNSSVNNDVNEENGKNIDKQNGNKENTVNGLPTTPVRHFPPISKTSVQRLQDFCMRKQSAYPFYDTTFKDRTFHIKCRIEFSVDNEKQEFNGTGSGGNIKEAKQMAADHIIEQLKEINLL